MPVALHPELDKFLNKKHGNNTAYTVSGAVATLPTSTLAQDALLELLRVAAALRHEVTLAAGVLTLTPK